MDKQLPVISIYYTDNGNMLMGVRNPARPKMAHYSEAGEGKGKTLCGLDCSTWKVKDVEHAAMMCPTCRRKASRL